MTSSIQMLINHGGKINHEMLNDYITTTGFVEINDYSIVKPGDQIKYIRTVEGKNDRFINSWVVVQNNPDYFLYKWWDGKIWSLQKNEIVKLYYKQLIKKKKPQKRIEFKKPTDEGLEVYIDDTLVYRARDNYSKKRFMSSKKFMEAMESKNFVVMKK